MQRKGKIAALIAAIMVVGSTGVQAAEVKRYSRYNEMGPFPLYQQIKWEKNDLLVNNDFVFNPFFDSRMALLLKPAEESKEETVAEPELVPKYGVDFTRIRERYPNRPFVKEVLTDEMQEHLNKREAETGIPGAVIIAQAIWEVGWDLNTPKGGGRDSMNLFNIKNCDGNYVVMAGDKWQCYNSYIEAVDAYIELITTLPNYAEAYAYIKNDGDIKKYYRMLGDAGYYEAPKDTYSGNCMSIIKANKLLAS